MLADHARSFDPLVEAAQELIEALTVPEFNPHTSKITPPQGDASGLPRQNTLACIRDNPVRSPASRPRSSESIPYRVAFGQPK